MCDATYWHKSDKKELPNSAVDAFIRDIVDVYKKHGMSIAHEDSQGAFIIEDCHDNNIEWLLESSVDMNGNTQ